MVREPIRLLDPEILIPSPSSASTPEFWRRMIAWTSDEYSLIGPETLAALAELAPTELRGPYISPNDFWKIIGKLSSRTFSPARTNRPICEEHLRDDYTPIGGDRENIELLINDLKGVGFDRPVALRTIEDCWAVNERRCTACDSSRVHKLLSEPNSVEDLVEIAHLWRDAFLVDRDGHLSQLEPLAKYMFPHLEFSDVAWKYLKTLVGSSNENLRLLVTHLSLLNDDVERIWAEQITTKGRQAEMRARNVPASPESPQTHRDAKAMKRRDFQFGGQTVRCEWHTKIRPDINSVHFAVEKGRVLVGVIIDHL